MSTITRELAKLFRKITNSEIDAEGNAHVVLSPADSLLINNARIALASLEAEPVAWLLSGGGAKNHVSFDSGNAYADPLREVTPLYTAPPAPVALTSGYSDFEEIWSSSTHPLTQDDEMKDFAWDIWNACRSAMLKHSEPFIVTSDHRMMEMPQVEAINAMLHGAEPVTTAYKLGNSPVIPDGWVLVPVEPTAEMQSAAAGAIRFDTTPINKLWTGNAVYRAMLAAAPQQE